MRAPKLITPLALVIAITIPAPATATSDGPQSPHAAAAKKHKKKKKRRKQRPAGPVQPLPPACADDAAEPDDAPASATAVSFAGMGTTFSRHHCAGDPDYFRIEVPAGGTAQFDVHPRPELDLGIRVYDDAGQLLGTKDAAGPGVTESIHAGNGTGSAVTRFAEVYSSTPLEGAYLLVGGQT